MYRGSLGRARMWNREPVSNSSADSIVEEQTPASTSSATATFALQAAPPLVNVTTPTPRTPATKTSEKATPTPPPQAHQIGPYSKAFDMAPAVVVPNPTGPPPSFINVSQVYLFQQQLQNQMIVTGTNPTREDNFRLQGVQWINDVRTALQL